MCARLGFMDLSPPIAPVFSAELPTKSKTCGIDRVQRRAPASFALRSSLFATLPGGMATMQQKLHRAGNNVIAVGRVTKSTYCDYAGWASKQGSIIKSWKRRYFVLKGRELIYFSERSPSGKGINEKGRLKIVGVEFTPEFTNGLLIKGELKNQTMKIQVETNQESLEWYAKIKEALLDGGNGHANGANDASGTRGAVTMQGWLFKEGQNFKTWKKRFMTLEGRVIKYHARANEAPLGEAHINDYNINPGRPFALDIFSENNRIFRIAAESFADIEAWDQAIGKVIGKPPCFGDPYADQKTPFLGETFNEISMCEGWLYKRGQRSTAWKKRFFTLNGFQLQYQDSPGENPKGEGSVVDIQLGDEGTFSMEIQLDTGRILSVTADSQDQVDMWVDAICAMLEKDPASVEVVSAGARPSNAGGGILRRGLSMGARSNSVLLQSATVATGPDNGTRRTGWLNKQGQRMKSWKRRFFVVEGSTITYFEQVHEDPKGSGVVQQVAVNPSFPNCVDISLTTGRVLRVSAESPEEIRSWFVFLSELTENGSSSDRRSSISGSSGSNNYERQSLDAMSEPGKGWLMKKGKNFKTWKRRYFVLDGKKLSYSSGVGENPLGCGLVSYVTLGNERPFCIDVRFQNGRILNVAASSEAEMITWCKALQSSMRSQAKSEESDDNAEFDFDDDNEDNIASEMRQSSVNRPRGSSLSQQRTSVSQQRSSMSQQRSSLNQNPSLGRGSSLDSDESFDDGLPYMDFTRASLDNSLPGCSGWLRKEGSTVKNWKLRYFTLKGTTLTYFKSDKGPLLKALKVCHVLPMRAKKFCLEVTMETGRKLLIAADTQAEYDRWLAALHQAVSAEKEKDRGRKSEPSNRVIMRL